MPNAVGHSSSRHIADARAPIRPPILPRARSLQYGSDYNGGSAAKVREARNVGVVLGDRAKVSLFFFVCIEQKLQFTTFSFANRDKEAPMQGEKLKPLVELCDDDIRNSPFGLLLEFSTRAPICSTPKLLVKALRTLHLVRRAKRKRILHTVFLDAQCANFPRSSEKADIAERFGGSKRIFARSTQKAHQGEFYWICFASSLLKMRSNLGRYRCSIMRRIAARISQLLRSTTLHVLSAALLGLRAFL